MKKIIKREVKTIDIVKYFCDLCETEYNHTKLFECMECKKEICINCREHIFSDWWGFNKYLCPECFNLPKFKKYRDNNEKILDLEDESYEIEQHIDKLEKQNKKMAEIDGYIKMPDFS